MSTTIEDAGVEPFAEPEFRERLEDLPPSAKLVAKVLESGELLSQGELADRSLLPDRTVGYALGRLQDVDLVDSRHSFDDARKQVYFLTP